MWPHVASLWKSHGVTAIGFKSYACSDSRGKDIEPTYKWEKGHRVRDHVLKTASQRPLVKEIQIAGRGSPKFLVTEAEPRECTPAEPRGLG